MYCFILIPAHVVALQREAGSDSQCCKHTAHQPVCKLHDRLRKFGGGEK